MQIRFLSDCSEVIPALALLINLELQLGDQSSYSMAIERLKCRALNRDKFPLTLVAFEDTLPIGMVSLVECDLSSRPHLTPWIASLVVAAPYQGRGIGRNLMSEMECHAARLGFNRVFLYTWTAANFYSKMGWKIIDTVKPERFPESVIMEKRFIP